MGPLLVVSRRSRRKESTRRQLLAAGRRLFGERGLYESRIEDLAEHAGIAKGTLYLYFRSKEDLVLEVTAAGYEQLRMAIRSGLGGARTRTAIIRALVRIHVEFFAENPDLMRIFHQVRGMLKFRRPEWAPFRRPLEGHIRFLTQLLATVSDRPRWPAPRNRSMAVEIYGLASGVTSVRSVLEPRSRLIQRVRVPPSLAAGIRSPSASRRKLRTRTRRKRP